MIVFDSGKKQMNECDCLDRRVKRGSITTVCVCLVHQGATAIYWDVLELQETSRT